jgi:hypothetical protein
VPDARRETPATGTAELINHVSGILAGLVGAPERNQFGGGRLRITRQADLQLVFGLFIRS